MMLQVILLATAGMLGATAGCRDRDEGPKYHEVDGRVTSINLATGEVGMNCYIPKQRTNMDITGKLAPSAEILINGATAGLEDVRVDDQVTVTGYLQKRDDGDPFWVATKVRITRGEGATQPAAAPQTRPE